METINEIRFLYIIEIGKFFFISLLLIYSCCLYAQSNNNTIEIIIKGLRSDKGQVIVAMFNSSSVFPEERDKAYCRLKSNINGKQVKLSFSTIPDGEYAISFYHDENENNKFDFNFLKIPKEGYGASNNARGHWGPPAFKDASFKINNGQTKHLTMITEY